MAVYRFKDVRGFEAAMGQSSQFSRFTLTPVLAGEWFGVSSTAVADMIGKGGLDAVITDDGYTFVDANELAAHEVRACDNPRSFGWVRAAFSN